MLADNKQIDERTNRRNQNRSAALGRPAMKLLGRGASTKEKSQKNQNRRALGRPAMKLLGGGGGGGGGA